MKLKGTLLKINRWRKLRVKYWKEYYFEGERELKELRKLVPSNLTAVDIGGNIGIYTYHLHRLAAKVIVFEPNPYYAEFIKDLRLKKTEVITAALSNKKGKVYLQVPQLDNGQINLGMATIDFDVANGYQVAQSIPVEMRIFDEFNFKNIGFIKIDVEGHEEKVIEGAYQTILANKPILLIEIEERNNKGGLNRIAESLSNIGYEGYFFRKGKLISIKDFDHTHNQTLYPTTTEAHKNMRSSSYVYNFIFIPKKP